MHYHRNDFSHGKNVRLRYLKYHFNGSILRMSFNLNWILQGNHEGENWDTDRCKDAHSISSGVEAKETCWWAIFKLESVICIQEILKSSHWNDKIHIQNSLWENLDNVIIPKSLWCFSFKSSLEHLVLEPKFWLLCEILGPPLSLKFYLRHLKDLK